ncbi:MAG: DUF4381 domain-containing protein [Xanthomonadaceae bacterium]|jgi:hypothetical protein|nr:DUF4381 domain-containing protein [Xanthomonadaceae bacterium]
MNPADLPLHDVHFPPPPSWWPPAPGWWVLAGGALLLLVLGTIWLVRCRRRYRQWMTLFDQTCQGEASPEKLAAMSELLRRAARRVDKEADRLHGEDWLRFLDGEKRRDFLMGPGQVLLEGAYLRQVDPEVFARFKAVARARFLTLMAGRR